MGSVKEKIKDIGLSDDEVKSLQDHPRVVMQSKDFFNSLCSVCKGKVYEAVIRRNERFTESLLCCRDCKNKYNKLIIGGKRK